MKYEICISTSLLDTGKANCACGTLKSEVDATSMGPRSFKVFIRLIPSPSVMYFRALFLGSITKIFVYLNIYDNEQRSNLHEGLTVVKAVHVPPGRRGRSGLDTYTFPQGQP